MLSCTASRASSAAPARSSGAVEPCSRRRAWSDDPTEDPQDRPDECVKWSVVHPFNNTQTGGPRGVTWTPGIFNQDTCEFEDPAVWIGYLPQQFGTAHMARLDGDDGTVEETVVINNWVVGDTSWGPYGAACGSPACRRR